MHRGLRSCLRAKYGKEGSVEIIKALYKGGFYESLEDAQTLTKGKEDLRTLPVLRAGIPSRDPAQTRCELASSGDRFGDSG